MNSTLISSGRRRRGTGWWPAAMLAVVLAGLAAHPAHAATFFVTNVNNAGPNSLRKAIEDANLTAAVDTVVFLIGGVIKTIKPTTPLPAITQPLVLDGTQNPGYAGTPVVELDGSLLASGSGLGIYTNDSVVKGLVVRGFPGTGIVIGGSGNAIRNCYIGVDRTGQVAAPNAGYGISVSGTQNVIGGTVAGTRNLISGNASNGILLYDDAHFTAIYGNYIGTNAAGTAAIGNGSYGIRVFGAKNQIGAPNAGNLISGNNRGVALEAGADITFVRGNIIGLNATGTAKLPNSGGLSIGSDSNLVGGSVAGAGNVISGNAYDGIAIQDGATGNTIAGNKIGTNLDGSVARGNDGYGIRTIGVATNNTIGGTAAGSGNLISGNGRGISFEYGATGNHVYGNVIGLNGAGNAKMPNNGSAVQLSAPGNFVGGPLPAMRNVLSGNVWDGVAIDEDAPDSVVQGNYIGTDVNGTVALGNGSYGIRIISATDCTIGGAAVGEGNVVSGNERGISLEYGATGNTLQGNLIGVTKTGTAKLANKGTGIEIFAPGNQIGGTAAGAGNVVSGNAYSGIGLSGPEATGNVIEGNKIGTAIDGTTFLGNRYFGVEVNEAFGNTIGGTAAGAGNVVAGNEWRGMFFPTGHGNAILGNSMFGNVELGIDLGLPGLTANDAFDADPGANHGQNFPVLTSVVVNGATTAIAGKLHGTPATSFRIEFFASAACDESGFGEGAAFFGSANVTTDANGEAMIAASLPVASPGSYVTATATSSSNDTSEFSPCALVGGGGAGQLQFAENPFLGWEQDGTVTITVTRSLGATGTVTVNYTTADLSAHAPADYTATSGTLTFDDGEVLKTFAVPVALDAIDEGNQESIALQLSAPTGGATLGPWATSELILIDYDASWPNVSISDAAVVEGDAGTKYAAFTVKVSPSNHAVPVQFGTHDGTAKKGQDYQETTGTITFQPGDGPKTILVPVYGDQIQEEDEVFYVHIYSVGQATVSGYPTAVIYDDDGPSGSDLIFEDGFEGNGTAAWSTTTDDGSGVIVSAGSALKGAMGLGIVVDDTHKLFVQDDSPDGEKVYGARFHFDPNGFQTGGAAGQKTTRILALQQKNPNRLVSWIDLRSKNGGHQISARTKVAGGGTVATPWIPLAAGPHAIELRWSRSSTASSNDGLLKLWVDGSEVASLTGLDIELGAVDLARLGAVVVKTGAQGTMRFDSFESRRLGYIGPEAP
ncbi:MAG TPA: Calx-beta domain-containing protein [Candidatus Binatia bacterium]|nr:Calx-beta domain-containing protein [Candidatus Binatia bacterium]